MCPIYWTSEEPSLDLGDHVTGGFEPEVTAPDERWGLRLRRLRIERKLSLQTLAARLGTTKQRLSQIERGDNDNATLELLLGLQREFQLASIEALLGEMPSERLARTRTSDNGIAESTGGAPAA